MATARKYIVTFTDGKRAKVTAESMKRDGSGFYFYDKDGKQVANWADGTVASAVDASAFEEDK